MVDGKWVKYNNSSDINVLINSVKGVNADWHRITYPEILDSLFNYNNGEIHVFYTRDESGNYTIPRMFIELTRNNKTPRVTLVYGLEKHENVECELLDALKDKLDEIGDKKFLYKERIADIKLLNSIYQKHINNIPLTVEEIKFLYEFDREIRYFGFSKDNKVAELRKKRKDMGDMNKIFRTMDDYEGDIKFTIPSYSDGLVFPKRIKGNFTLKNIKNLVNCILPQEIEGDINLPNVKSMKYVLCGKYVSGSIYIPSLEMTDHVVFAERVKEDFDVSSLHFASNTVFSRNVGGNVGLSSLERATDSVWPENVGGNIALSQYDADNFVMPSSFNRVILPVGSSFKEITGYPIEKKAAIEQEVLQKVLKR